MQNKVVLFFFFFSGMKVKNVSKKNVCEYKKCKQFEVVTVSPWLLQTCWFLVHPMPWLASLPSFHRLIHIPT